MMEQITLFFSFSPCDIFYQMLDGVQDSRQIHYILWMFFEFNTLDSITFLGRRHRPDASSMHLA